MFHGSGWWSYVRYDEEADRPTVDRALVRRVLSYARPYRRELAVVLVTIVVISLLSLLPPLLMRSLIDTGIPDEDLRLVTLLGLGMVAVPLINGAVGVAQRHASASMGEGIIFDLRCQLFGHLQRMSIGFFTNTKTGELMSRLNSDVVGAQQAVSSTFVTLVSNLFTVVATLLIMLGLEWRLTILAVSIVPIFIIASRQVGKRLRVVRRRQMEENAKMNSIMQETLSVSGALLVKLFGRTVDEDGGLPARPLKCGTWVCGRRPLDGGSSWLSAWSVRWGRPSSSGWEPSSSSTTHDVRHDRRVVRLPHQPLRADVCPLQRTGRVRHLARLVRASVRGHRHAGRHPSDPRRSVSIR